MASIRLVNRVPAFSDRYGNRQVLQIAEDGAITDEERGLDGIGQAAVPIHCGEVMSMKTQYPYVPNMDDCKMVVKTAGATCYIMTYQEILERARPRVGPFCKACPVCNGIACKNTVPGPGAKGTGTGFIRNYQKWQELCVNMDTICENASVDTSLQLFGRRMRIPVFAAPVGAMQLHYGDQYDDLTYNDILVSACAESGIAAFTGDGSNPAVMEAAVQAIGKNGGCGVPTVKPWNLELVYEKLAMAKGADPLAIAMIICHICLLYSL